MDVTAVVPILPTITALAVMLPTLLLAALASLAALRRPAAARQLLRLAWRQKYALLFLGFGVGGVGWAVDRWSVSHGPAVADETTAAGGWPMDRGSLDRSGWVRGAASPARATNVWSGGRPGEAFWASPAVVGNQVFCVGSRGDTGLISCWDSRTGQRLWAAAPRGYLATFSSPVIAGSYLVCGEGLHHARQARVVCLDLRPPRVGEVRWTFPTNGHVECTPVVVGDRVYVGAGDDGVYCLRLEPEVSAAQRVVWHAPGERYPDAETSLAVWDGRVYVGLGVGGQAVCVLDAETGEELARRAVPYPVFSPPAIEGGKLLVGMGLGDYVHPVEHPAGCVRCFDLATWHEEWSFPTGATVLGAVAVADEQVIVGCTDGWLYVLDRRGRLLRKWDSHWPIVAAPAVTDQFVYVVHQGGRLVALERRWLQPVWEVRLGSPGRYLSAPVVAQGRVFVGTERDGLRCVGESVPDTADAVWPGEGGGAGMAGCRDNSRLPPSARLLWQWTRLPSRDPPLEVTAPVAAVAGVVLVPYTAGAESGLACLETPAGQAGSPRVRWLFPTAAPVCSSPAIADGRVLAVAGAPDAPTKQLCAVDLSRGSPCWSVPLEGRGNLALTVATGRVYVPDGPRGLACYSVDGDLAWTRELGPLRLAVDAQSERVIAAIETPPTLVALDGPTGRPLWSCPLEHPATTAPAVRGNRIYFADREGLQARALVDGHVVWRVHDQVSGPLYVAPDRYAYVSAGGELVLGDVADGTATARLAGAVPGSQPLVGLNGVLFRGPQEVRCTDGQGRESHAFARFGSDEVTGAPVLSAGRVYLGLAQRGLLCFGGGEP